MTDIEIAREAKLQNINNISKICGLQENEIEGYGKYKAKINEQAFTRLKSQKERKINISYSNESYATRRRKNNCVNCNC